MVQLMQTGILQPESEAAAAAAEARMGRRRQSVKIGVDEYHQYARDTKRSRLSSDSLQWGMVASYPMQPQQYNPMNEPSPLGLKLNKSPSLVELIQTHLYQSYRSAAKPPNSGETICPDQKESKSLACNSDKLKASNIPASLLKIGKWEYQSRHEGDLAAKCYFAKHKLVWEVLHSGLKSKMEIQWSDITGMKADCPENGESSLKLVLARQPLFFRETNPQPRKHTLWQPCSDFTEGEATLNRFHFLTFPQGALQKHYEKLIQSDSRLNFLSRQPDMAVDPPYFESGLPSVFEELDPKSQFVDPNKAAEAALSPGIQDAVLPTEHTAIQPNFFKIEQQGHGGVILERHPLGPFSPNSVMAVNPIDGYKNQTGDFLGAGNRSIDQFKVPAGLHTSMSKLDVMNCLVNMMPPVTDPSSAEAVQREDQLEHIAEYLLNDLDSNIPLATDEKSVMARVNSLWSLLGKDNVEGCNSLKENHCDTFVYPDTIAMNQNKEKPHGVIFNNKPSVFESICASGGGEESAENHSMKPATGMMKKDSFGDLLHSLPHVASLPKFMNFSEDNQNHFC